MLGRPHLMLPDLGCDVDVAILRRLIEPLDCILRHDHVAVRLEGEGVARAPGIDLLPPRGERLLVGLGGGQDRKSTRLNSSHVKISYAVFCLKKKKKTKPNTRQ